MTLKVYRKNKFLNITNNLAYYTLIANRTSRFTLCIAFL